MEIGSSKYLFLYNLEHLNYIVIKATLITLENLNFLSTRKYALIKTNKFTPSFPNDCILLINSSELK